jgi:hypothetical protein
MPRFSRWIIYSLIIGAALMLVVAWFGFTGVGLKADWLAFYTAGRFALESRMESLYDLPAVQAWQSTYIGKNITAFLYPPIYAVFFAPFALLSPWAARTGWLAVGIVSAVFSTQLSRRWSRLSLPASLLALVAFPPLVFSLIVGQISPLTLLIFTSIASLEYQDRTDYLPGLLAGLALYKPQLLIPLLFFWLLRRRWRSLTGFGMMAVMIGVLSWLVSPQGSLAYLRLSLGFFSLAETANQSGANAAIFASFAWLGVLVALVVLAILVFWRKKPQEPGTLSLLWLAPVLVTPYLATYDLLLLILPFSFLVPLMKDDRWLRVWVILIYLAAYLAIPFLTVRPIVWLSLGLFIYLFYKSFRTEKGRT